ncbi:MAG TPA: hypothetical protein ENK05_14785 [Gammaproteobacteria bacterium]|nr:hypothetical protein [Gammaproteobacteria bacterium]
MTELPVAADLDVGALSRVFDKVTNSYKLLFFQALLNQVQSNSGSDGDVRISLREIGIEMLARAWYPYVYFRLSFGLQDQISKLLDGLVFQVGSQARAGNANTQKRLRNAIDRQWQQLGGGSLLRYVPCRLLTPFFSEDLRGVSDAKRNVLMADLSRKRFERRKPLYRLEKDAIHLTIHPGWAHYLNANYKIVEGWARWHWLRYLQKKNPSVPAIAEKLSPPAKREALEGHRKFWAGFIQQQRLLCLYSKVPLDPSNFALDHFVPWSFVCHDRPWNLIPVSPQANASKGNMLPHRKYIPIFVKSHAQALRVGQGLVGQQAWRQFLEPYITDLHLSEGALQDVGKLQRAYKNTLDPLFTLARQMGFASGWKAD